MRYRITLLLLLMAALTTGKALGSVVKSLNVNACLHKDGSCTIEEHWVIDLDSEDAKTEWYVAHKLIDGITLTGLTVEGFVPGQEGLNKHLVLYSAGDSTPTLATYDFSSDNSKWNFRNH